MASIQTEALVLRSVAFEESDRIVHLLTPATGRIAAIAKGARRSVRRFPGTLDLFNLLKVQIERRRAGTLARLESAQLIESFEPMRRDARRFGLGCHLLELLDRLAPEGGPQPERERLFDFAQGSLRVLAAATPDARLRAVLSLRTLAALGLCPELSRCVRCAGALEGVALGFHVAEGGPLCPTCGRDQPATLTVHRGTLRALEQALRMPLERVGRLALGPASLAEATELLRSFHRFHVGIELRSERFLDEILPATPPREGPDRRSPD